jgi:hypothetical protein
VPIVSIGIIIMTTFYVRKRSINKPFRIFDPPFGLLASRDFKFRKNLLIDLSPIQANFKYMQNPLR